MVPAMASRLEQAFDQSADDWLELAHELGSTPSAGLAHASACAANVSDFGLMLAWSKITTDFANKPEMVLVVCDDPWLYRHLCEIDGVEFGRAPGILLRSLKLTVRGYLSRVRCALTLAINHLLTREQKSVGKTHTTFFLVYGHPRSTAEGEDGYFGPLLNEIPGAQRILHVDCSSRRARQLRGNDQSVSLHAWGHFYDLLKLPLARWKPSPAQKSGTSGWLVRRAERLEGGTGQGAMIKWQQLCQRRWLDELQPDCVVWPWENHGWEREFVRVARARGVRTVGYQHSVIGRQMLNYRPHSNADDLASIPDMILCTGPSTAGQLAAWGIPKNRLKVGGALRIADISSAQTSASGPVYLALSFDADTARQMIDAAAKLTADGYRFLAKNHPMQPVSVSDNKHIIQTQKAFSAYDNLRAVVYAASTVGLEAAIAGLPTIRFQADKKIALDILPPTVSLTAADAAGLGQALADVSPLQIDRDEIFSPVDLDLWKRTLSRDPTRHQPP